MMKSTTTTRPAIVNKLLANFSPNDSLFFSNFAIIFELIQIRVKLQFLVIKINITPLRFYCQNTIFVDNIGQYHISEISGNPIFDIHWNDGEYMIFVSPNSYEELKEICDIICKYAKDFDQLEVLTNGFQDNYELHDYFAELFGEEEGYKIVDDAIEYSKSLFEKSQISLRLLDTLTLSHLSGFQ